VWTRISLASRRFTARSRKGQCCRLQQFRNLGRPAEQRNPGIAKRQSLASAPLDPPRYAVANHPERLAARQFPQPPQLSCHGSAAPTNNTPAPHFCEAGYIPLGGFSLAHLVFIGSSDHDLRGGERFFLRLLLPTLGSSPYCFPPTHAYFRATAVRRVPTATPTRGQSISKLSSAWPGPSSR
jgi:hypothetical protein